jgi:hypothetical protein
MQTMETCRACGATWSNGSRFCPECDAVVGVTERPNRSTARGAVTRSVPDYLGLALFSILFFWPTGFAAVWNASRANEASARQSYDFANKLATNARRWCIASFLVPLTVFVLFVLR